MAQEECISIVRQTGFKRRHWVSTFEAQETRARACTLFGGCSSLMLRCRQGLVARLAGWGSVAALAELQVMAARAREEVGAAVEAKLVTVEAG